MQVRAATLRGTKRQVNLVESDLDVPGLTKHVQAPIINKEYSTNLWHKRMCHMNHQKTHMLFRKFVKIIPLFANSQK